MKTLFVLSAAAALAFASCSNGGDAAKPGLSEYFQPGPDTPRNGGIRMVPIRTPRGEYRVWTKRFGHNPKVRLLLLNGGPGATHEYFECFESFLPAEGIEFIYYDQLGCGNSDNPGDTSLWDLPRFVEEVEQVRIALGLDSSNFFLLGHSWGGILGMEYALKYQRHLKGLVISNMMSSCPEYGRYSEEVLARQMDPAVLDSIRRIEAAGDYSHPGYMGLLLPHFYAKHILRMPLDRWPEPVNRSFGKMNPSLYVTMQGPSEFGIAGKLTRWDRKADLGTITVPTLVIGATHDTMDPAHMEWMSKEVRNGSFLLCPNGGHMCMWDDQAVYMAGLIRFLNTHRG